MIIKVVPKIKLPLGTNSVFDYTFDGDVRVGQIVEVGFRNRVVEAVVLEREKEERRKEGFKLKKVVRVLSEEPMVGEREIEVMKWISEYYFVPLSVVARTFVPDVVKKQRNIEIKKKGDEVGDFKLAVLKSRVDEIKRAIDEIVGVESNVLFIWNDFREKVLVYIKLIEQCLSQDEQVMIILPQVVDIEFLFGFLEPRFGSKLAILHAGMGKIAQYISWRKISQNKAKIILGTRSAILAPMTNAGLILLKRKNLMITSSMI